MKRSRSVYGRADHRGSEGAPGWAFGGGAVPEGWDQRGAALQLALEVRRPGGLGRAPAAGTRGGEPEAEEAFRFAAFSHRRRRYYLANFRFLSQCPRPLMEC